MRDAVDLLAKAKLHGPGLPHGLTVWKEDIKIEPAPPGSADGEPLDIPIALGGACSARPQGSLCGRLPQPREAGGGTPAQNPLSCDRSPDKDTATKAVCICILKSRGLD